MSLATLYQPTTVRCGNTACWSSMEVASGWPCRGIGTPSASVTDTSVVVVNVAVVVVGVVVVVVVLVVIVAKVPKSKPTTG